MIGTIWAETWRLGITIVALGGLVLIWALVLPALTPFGGVYTPEQVEKEKERSHRYVGLHKWSVRIDILFFWWLVVEGALLVPWLLSKYPLR